MDVRAERAGRRERDARQGAILRAQSSGALCTRTSSIPPRTPTDSTQASLCMQTTAQIDEAVSSVRTIIGESATKQADHSPLGCYHAHSLRHRRDHLSGHDRHVRDRMPALKKKHLQPHGLSDQTRKPLSVCVAPRLLVSASSRTHDILHTADHATCPRELISRVVRQEVRLRAKRVSERSVGADVGASEAVGHMARRAGRDDRDRGGVHPQRSEDVLLEVRAERGAGGEEEGRQSSGDPEQGSGLA